MLVACFYGMPGVREEQESRVCEELIRVSRKGRVLIMGYFNLPGIHSVQEQRKGKADEDFQDRVQYCFLQFGEEVEIGEYFGTSDANMCGKGGKG